jgi:hypothetical protein
MAGLTFGIFIWLDHLPLRVIQKSKTFILLSLIPLGLHAIYSLLEDSADRAKQALAQHVEEEETESRRGAKA